LEVRTVIYILCYVLLFTFWIVVFKLFFFTIDNNFTTHCCVQDKRDWYKFCLHILVSVRCTTVIGNELSRFIAQHEKRLLQNNNNIYLGKSNQAARKGAGPSKLATKNTYTEIHAQKNIQNRNMLSIST